MCRVEDCFFAGQAAGGSRPPYLVFMIAKKLQAERTGPDRKEAVTLCRPLDSGHAYETDNPALKPGPTVLVRSTLAGPQPLSLRTTTPQTRRMFSSPAHPVLPSSKSEGGRRFRPGVHKVTPPTHIETMKTISPTAAADNPPLPLEPEKKPLIVRDHGVDTDEAHDIDTAAGDEGIDDEAGDDFDNNVRREK